MHQSGEILPNVVTLVRWDQLLAMPSAHWSFWNKFSTYLVNCMPKIIHVNIFSVDCWLFWRSFMIKCSQKEQNGLIGSRQQCDKICDKSSPNEIFWAISKNINYCVYFWAALWNDWASFYSNIWSHAHILVVDNSITLAKAAIKLWWRNLP